MIYKYTSLFIEYSKKACSRILMVIHKSRLNSCGSNVIFDPLTSEFSYEKLRLGSNVFIGARAWFRSTHSEINICSNVMFGPDVKILGGNHKFNIVGKNMIDLKKNKDHKDMDITIEDDVWIGANVIILSGVTISRGSIIGAGSIVTKSTEPFSINAGNPCKFIKPRFSDADLATHKTLLS